MDERPQDPFADREAKKYESPIASRELIMQLLQKCGNPLSYNDLSAELRLTTPEQLEALRRRLKAMLRDGQLMQNRRGAYGLVSNMHLIAGRVSAHKDGFGFLIPDAGAGDDLFLSAKQMRTVFHGDRVLAAVIGIDQRGRKEGRIVEVIERNTQEVVGQFFEEGGVSFVQPAGKQFTQDIIIPYGKNHDAQHGQIVQARIVEQPGKHRQAIGEVIEIIGEHMAPGMEIDIAIRSYQLPNTWPETVLEEIKEYDQEVPSNHEESRKDIRDLPLVTIDGEDAKDFDDAVYCAPNKDGWRLIVAIADVSSYVQPDTALDQEAKKRGNSVYFPGRVIPMLPEILSNGLCSLNPKVDRLCMVCDMTINEDGKIIQYKFYSALMNSKARMTYTNVDKIIRGDQKLRKQFSDIVEHLDNLYDLYKVLWQARQQRGALDFETQETRIIFGRDKKIERIVATERNDAHRLIEECMLAANVSTAEYLLTNNVPVLYRVHEGPTEEKLIELRKFLGEFGLQLQGGNKPQPKDYAKLLKQIQPRVDKYLIQTVLLRSLRQAIYAPDNVGHFGLGYEAYTHFTSPIRRYPDLLVHRALKSLVEKNKPYPYDRASMTQFGEQCSYTERRADEVTRDVTDWLKCEYMMDKVGQEFEGMISGVTSFGLFILLKDIYVEGLLHISNLASDYYEYDSTQHRLRGQRSGKVYRMGDSLRVLVAGVNLEKREIDFEPVN